MLAAAPQGPREAARGYGISQRRVGWDDRGLHRVEGVCRDGALDAQPFGARAHPPDPTAHRVGGHAQVGADGSG